MKKVSLLYFLSLLLFAVVFQACDKEEPKPMPKSYTITSIVLQDYPSFSPDGDDWDPVSGYSRYPDCFFALYNSASPPPTLPRITDTKDNVSVSNSFSLSPSYIIDNLDATWILELYDEDQLGNEYMGEISFVLKDNMTYINDGKDLYDVLFFKQGQMDVVVYGYWNF